MATNTLRKLAQVLLSNADTLIYTCPALTHTTIVSLFIVNIDTTDRTFRLHQVNAGGSISATNSLYYDQPLSAKRTMRDGGILLEPGQMLRGLVSAANTITVAIFGIESTEAG